MAAESHGSPTLWPRLHGMLMAFPIAGFVGALATDIAYADSAQMQWANFSVWLIAAGALVGWIALIGEILAMILRPRHQRASGALRRVLLVVVLVLAVVNGFVHSRDAWTSVVPTGLTLSTIIAAPMLVIGWLGHGRTDPVRGERV